MHGAGYIGMLGYVFISAIAIVIAPISTFPLIPIASAMWGWILTALLSIVGWVIGSQVAFYIARHYGKPLVEKLIGLKKIQRLENNIPTQNMFWIIVLLRMTLPVDVLSYALGLFSNVKASTYFYATTLGVTPFAFLYAYTGTLSIKDQLFTLISVGIFLLLVFILRKRLKTFM